MLFFCKRQIDTVGNRHSFFRPSSPQFQVSTHIKWETKQGSQIYQQVLPPPPEWTALKNKDMDNTDISQLQPCHIFTFPNGTNGTASFSRIGTWFGCFSELREEFPWSFSCIGSAFTSEDLQWELTSNVIFLSCMSIHVCIKYICVCVCASVCICLFI